MNWETSALIGGLVVAVGLTKFAYERVKNGRTDKKALFISAGFAAGLLLLVLRHH